jgi:hypothetical protein
MFISEFTFRSNPLLYQDFAVTFGSKSNTKWFFLMSRKTNLAMSLTSLNLLCRIELRHAKRSLRSGIAALMHVTQNLKSRFGDRLSGLKIVLVFSSSSWQIPGYYLKLDHGHFLQNPFNLIIYFIYHIFDTIQPKILKASINKLFAK